MSHEHQSDERALPAELAAVEKQLAGLVPAVPRLDRDRLMFEAGRAAAEAELRAVHLGEGASAASSRSAGQGEPSPRPSLQGRGKGGWFWPVATATMTAATVLLSVMLVRQERQITALQLASVQRETPAPVAPAETPRAVDGPDESLMLAASPEAWPLEDRPTQGYLGARFVALTVGVDALAARWRPAVVGTGNDAPLQPQTSRELLDEMLPGGI